MENFKHKIPIQIRFKDVDMMGHINNANYATYVELARLNYFEEVFGSKDQWTKQNGLILARLEIDFRRAITYQDKVVVWTRCSRIGTKSFDLTWVITSTDELTLMAEGKAVLACYDYGLGKAVPISAEKRQKISKFEGISF